ncbi:hypothetical protein AMJ80_03240 [bacterium SM23_31]|nr:MAG: hypothetical protein AMJ80_03240 [bacterium SM23_31]
MEQLSGLTEYLRKNYNNSVFDKALSSKEFLDIYLHGYRTIRAKILENPTYDLKIKIDDQPEEIIPKINIKFIHLSEISTLVTPLIKVNNKIREHKFPPILSPVNRYHIKNKSLFPLMKERTVVFFTLLEGETIRGIISEFSKYDVTVYLKGGIPLTILRHSVYDLRDKKGRCFLKSFQQKSKDWEKSEQFVQ